MEDAKTILKRWGGMASDRTPWDGIWQTVADFGMPRKGNITSTRSGPGTNPANRLYDTTVIDCIATLGSGHSTAITPAGSQWFAWEAPEDIRGDVADAWYNKASEVARKVLTGGNFHTMLNEGFDDRSGFGIFCMAAMPHKENMISFQTHPVGNFCCEEDADGNVDTVFLRRPYSISQLVQLFGEEKIVANDRLARSWERFKTQGLNMEHHVVHAVFPRLKRDAGKRDVFNMRYASVWVAEDGKSVLERSGFEEMPYMVSRYLKSSGSKQQYGYGPFQQVHAAVVNANKSKQILQVVRQKQAVPPVLIPDDLTGNVDMRPGGKTTFNSRNGALPQEWLTRANSQGMLEELEDDRAAIRSAFHTDLFRMFADREKQMTAREVSELAAEKLMPFSPSFTRFTADFQVMMERIFAILFRAGAFGGMGDVPEEVIRRKKGSPAMVPPPKVIYQSRIALAIRQAETAAADRMVERAMMMARTNPDAMDNIDMDRYIRLSGRNDGVSEDIVRPEAEMKKMRRERMAREQAESAGPAAQGGPPGMGGMPGGLPPELLQGLGM